MLFLFSLQVGFHWFNKWARKISAPIFECIKCSDYVLSIQWSLNFLWQFECPTSSVFFKALQSSWPFSFVFSILFLHRHFDFLCGNLKVTLEIHDSFFGFSTSHFLSPSYSSSRSLSLLNWVWNRSTSKVFLFLTHSLYFWIWIWLWTFQLVAYDLYQKLFGWLNFFHSIFELEKI